MTDLNNLLRFLGPRIHRALIGPEIVQIDLTDSCNNNCIGCWARSPFLRDDDHYDTLEKGEMPISTFKRLLDELKSLAVHSIFLGGGGDPLCYPHFSSAIEAACSGGFEVFVNTNYLLANRDINDLFINQKVSLVIISLWAATPHTYSIHHPNKGPASFLHLTEMIGDLSSRRRFGSPKIKLYHVVTCHNADEVPQMVEHAGILGVDEVEFSVLDPIPGRTDLFLPDTKQRAMLLKYFDSLTDGSTPLVHRRLFCRRLRNIDAVKGVYDNGYIESIPCYAGWFYARVTTVGQINSCLKSHRISVGRYPDQDFGAIWFGAGQNEFRSHTFRLKYDDPFLYQVGHDIHFALPGCYRICDNIGHNEQIHRQFQLLSHSETEWINKAAAFCEANSNWDREQLVKSLSANYSSSSTKNSSPTIELIKERPPFIEVTDLSRNFQEIQQKLACIGANEPLVINITAKDIGKLPRILNKISLLTSRNLPEDALVLQIKSIKDISKQLMTWLSDLEIRLKFFDLHLKYNFSQIESVLKRFEIALDKERYSENELLTALGAFWETPLVGPSIFHLDIANACTSGCVYCWFHSKRAEARADYESIQNNKSTLFPTTIYDDLLTDLSNLGGTQDLVFSGKGEPFSHPDILEMLQKAKHAGFFVTLFTGGTLLNKYFDKILDVGPDLIYISLSASNQEEYVKIRPNRPKNEFDQIIDSLRRLINKKKQCNLKVPKIVLVDILCSLNINSMIAFADLAKNLGVEHARFQLAAIEPYLSDLRISNQALQKSADDWPKISLDLANAGVEPVGNLSLQLKRKETDWTGDKYLRTGCFAGYGFSRVWANGEISFCCSPKPIASLFEQRFREIWLSDNYDQARSAARRMDIMGKYSFKDGSPLWDPICLRCPNYETNEKYLEIFYELDLPLDPEF